MTPDQLEVAGLRLDLAGPVATVTLHRPERRNAQTPAMWRALAAVPDHLGDDIRVVVVRGSGQSFSAGLDLAMLSPRPAAGAAGDPGLGETVAGLLDLDDDALAATIADYQRGFTWLRDARWVSVAAVQGHAIGAGFQLALACDLRILADDAVLSMREVALGLVPDLTGTKHLVDAVGYARALELCATARDLSADEAGTLGLATCVVPRAELDPAVAACVQQLVAHPAGAVRATKALLTDASRRSLDEQMALERAAQVDRLRELATTLTPAAAVPAAAPGRG